MFFFRYLLYLLRSQNEHGVHSPFLFNLYLKSIKNRHHFYAFDDIEKTRKKLLNNHQEIPVTDFGAGSKNNHFPNRKISKIAQTSLKSAYQAELLFKLTHYLKANTIIELGTSLGISTAYLASPSSKSKVYSFEGCPNISKVAQQTFDELSLKNIEIIEGNIDETLPSTLKKIDKIDLAYLDANHRYEPTMNYFNLCLEKVHNETVLIFDDIHWSNEMQQAWEEIKKHPQVTVSVDVFYFGLVFFKKELSKEDFILRTGDPFMRLIV